MDLGVRGSIFYLPDSSPDYVKLSSNKATRPYMFPLSSIRQSLPQLVSGKITENTSF